MTTDVSAHTRTAREEFIADLRDFADMLERFPHLPAERWMSASVQYSVLDSFGDEEARVKEVLRVAAILGVEPTFFKDGSGVSARLDCGQVRYVVHTNTGLEVES